MNHAIRVMIVDDSAVVRQTLKDILSTEPDMNVIGVASNPFIAADKMQTNAPDVLLLDIEMPMMDGIAFLQKLMTQHPLPVVMCSSIADNGSDNAMRALELGAVEIISKPRIETKQFLNESKIRICDAIRAASKVRPKLLTILPKVEPKLTADAILAKPRTRAVIETTEKVVVVGASTGGPEAIQTFLSAFPMHSPPIVIVQHMPEHFTKSFAHRLDKVCQMTVKEAENGDTVMPGRALIAPGNRHTLLKRSGARYYVEVKDGPLVSRHRPSVDVLFRSAARYCARNALAVLMTGMGDDGARGLEELRETGAYTIAQDEKTSVVFGMPQEAIKRNAVCAVLALPDIAGTVLSKCRY